MKDGLGALFSAFVEESGLVGPDSYIKIPNVIGGLGIGFGIPAQLQSLSAEIQSGTNIPGSGDGFGSVDGTNILVELTGIKFSNRAAGARDIEMVGSVPVLTLCEFGNFEGYATAVFVTMIACYWHEAVINSTSPNNALKTEAIVLGTLIENRDVLLAGGAANYIFFQGCILSGCAPVEFSINTDFGFGLGSKTPAGANMLALQNTLVKNSIGDGIAFHGGNGAIANTKVSGATASGAYPGDGISLAKGAGNLQLKSVSGAGNARYGLYVDDGGQVLADAATDIAGTLADFQVGVTVPPGGWAVAPFNLPDPATFARLKAL
jgi:hypothetical protein